MDKLKYVAKRLNREEVSRLSHTQEVGGANPPSATIEE